LESHGDGEPLHSKMSARRHFPREAKQESGKEKKEVGLRW
jgi:hypothetical protein